MLGCFLQQVRCWSDPWVLGAEDSDHTPWFPPWEEATVGHGLITWIEIFCWHEPGWALEYEPSP